MNKIKNKKVVFRDLGLVDYQKAWDYQEQLFNEIIAMKLANRERPVDEQAPTKNYLLFCQHPHVYTLGKSGKEGHLLLNEAGLHEKKAVFYKINRGGDITYHGPGQLVGYPIIDLDNFTSDIHKYLRKLEEAVIRVLAEYGLDGGRIEGLTGVWLDYEKRVNPRKICAIGVKTSRWVTMHGFALNVNTQLEYFDNIIPCGIPDKAVTSLEKELNRTMDMDEVARKVKNRLQEVFGFEYVENPEKDDREIQ